MLADVVPLDAPDDETTIIPRFSCNRNGRALIASAALRKELRECATHNLAALGCGLSNARSLLEAAGTRDPANAELVCAIDHLLALIANHSTDIVARKLLFCSVLHIHSPPCIVADLVAYIASESSVTAWMNRSQHESLSELCTGTLANTISRLFSSNASAWCLVRGQSAGTCTCLESQLLTS